MELLHRPGARHPRAQGLTRSRLRSGLVLTVLAALAAGVAGLGVPVQAKASAPTVTFAELAGTPPTYILPLESGPEQSQENAYWFANQLFLPLYWFGQGANPTMNKALSLAYPPVFSHNNTEVTIRLKPWRWSDGAPVTARDLIFWFNLMSAVTDPNAPAIGSSSSPGPGDGGFVPGGIPENIVSYTQHGQHTVVLKLNTSYSPTWYLYNELSQVYPIPVSAWDRLASGGAVGNYDASAQAREAVPNTSPVSYISKTPGTATSGALGVAQFLNLQAQSLSTYASNPLWKVVDGPFRLAQFTTAGFVKLVPNKKYSGPDKPKVKAFEELPFASDTAEYNALRSGGVSIGYVPSQDVPTIGTLERSQGLRVAPWQVFGIQYMGINFTNPKVGPIFKQLYFRQALQDLVNQSQYVKVFDGGYATVESGLAPTYPPHNQFESPLLSKGQLYPYNVARAVALLKTHGWAVHPGGTTSCQRAGSGASQCGAGVTAGEPASFTLLYASGNAEANSQMQAFASTLESKAGIKLSLQQQPFGQVIGTTFAGCTYSSPCTNWELGDWLGGWTFAPDFFPTGDELFATGAGSNVGDYSNPTNDANINQTETASSPAAAKRALYRYENFLSRQLPVLLFPQQPLYIAAYRKSLTGVLPQSQNIYGIITPQLLG